MIDDALPPNSTFDGDKRDCPRTTPEARAELRRRYGSPPTGVVRCLACREMMELAAPKAERTGVLWTWRCPRASEHPLLHHIDHYGDLDVLAACDDADALAGALAEAARLRTALERLRNAAQFGIEGMDTAEVLDAIVADADGALAPESKGAEQ